MKILIVFFVSFCVFCSKPLKYSIIMPLQTDNSTDLSYFSFEILKQTYNNNETFICNYLSRIEDLLIN